MGRKFKTKPNKTVKHHPEKLAHRKNKTLRRQERKAIKAPARPVH